MPVYAVDPNQIRRYVPLACREDPEDEQTVILLRGLTDAERTEIMNRAAAQQRIKVRAKERGKKADAAQSIPVDMTHALGDVQRLYLSYGIVGWERFYLLGADGRPTTEQAEFRTRPAKNGRERPTAATLSYIQEPLRSELAAEIEEATVIDEDTAGN